MRPNAPLLRFFILRASLPVRPACALACDAMRLRCVLGCALMRHRAARRDDLRCDAAHNFWDAMRARALLAPRKFLGKIRDFQARLDSRNFWGRILSFFLRRKRERERSAEWPSGKESRREESAAREGERRPENQADLRAESVLRSRVMGTGSAGKNLPFSLGLRAGQN